MKVAVIQGREIYNNYEETSELIAKDITNWAEVTQKEAEELQMACQHLNRGSGYNYHSVIFFPTLNEEDTQDSFIFKTVEDYRKELLRQKEENRKRLELEEQKRLEKKAKRELKTREQKLKLLQDLKKELEGK